jgi:hypothetical protein
MNRLDTRRQATIIHDLVEGSSLRSIERKHQVSLNTALKLLEDAGDMAIAYFQDLKDLKCRYIQADEFFTFVGHRRKKREWAVPGEAWTGSGEIWVYLAIDADTKIVIDFLPGTHEVYDATKFMKSVSGKLKRTANGTFDVRPHIVVDGLPGYKEATTLARRFPTQLALVLKEHGIPADFIAQEVWRMADACYAKTANRSVVGILSEFVRQTEFWLAAYAYGKGDDDDLLAISVKLAETPCSPLYKGPVSPDRALHKLVNGIG